MKAAFLGFGEAGPVFAGALLATGWKVSAFDILPERRTVAEAIGAHFAADPAEAVAGAEVILSTVTAANALAAAEACVGGLTAGQLYADLNSVPPAAKRAVGAVVGRAGAAFVEAVAMDTVPQCGAAVPILACGSEAGRLSVRLAPAGLRIEDLGPGYGTASAVKLTRSIFIKGLEALFAEMVEMGETIGQTERVLASITATFPGLDWQGVAGYHLNRMARHGARRAAEMRGCAGMLREVGIDAALTEAIAAKHEGVARRIPAFEGETLSDFTAALRRTAG